MSGPQDKVKEELKTVHPSGKSVTFTTIRLQRTAEKGVAAGRRLRSSNRAWLKRKEGIQDSVRGVFDLPAAGILHFQKEERKTPFLDYLGTL